MSFELGLQHGNADSNTRYSNEQLLMRQNAHDRTEILKHLNDRNALAQHEHQLLNDTYIAENYEDRLDANGNPIRTPVLVPRTSYIDRGMKAPLLQQKPTTGSPTASTASNGTPNSITTGLGNVAVKQQQTPSTGVRLPLTATSFNTPAFNTPPLTSQSLFGIKPNPFRQ
jgi:hypothetical protein